MLEKTAFQTINRNVVFKQYDVRLMVFPGNIPFFLNGLRMHNGRLQHIDVWRFCAIALVIISHIVAFSHPWYQEVVPGLIWRLRPTGVVGVQIFFCISGFVICRGLMREMHETGMLSLHAFFIRRAYRIFPPLAAFLACAGLLVALGLIDLNARQFSQTTLMLCNISPLGDCGYALAHTWSLAYEEQFYLIFPFLAISFGLVRKRERLLMIILCLVVTFYVMRLDDDAGFLAGFASTFLYLLAGCAVALYWTELEPMFKRLPTAAWGCITLLTVCSRFVALPAAFVTYVYPLVFPVLICVTVFGTPIHQPLVRKLFSNPTLAHLGRISYGVYLLQQLATNDYGLATPFAALGLVAATFVVAHVSFEYFEQPFIRRGALRSREIKAAHRWDDRTMLIDPLADDAVNQRFS